jgi:hypothetical protein
MSYDYDYETMTAFPGDDPLQYQNATTWMTAEIVDLKDPMSRGQAKVNVENLQDGGYDNTTHWTPILGNQLSGNEQRLASGIWWPPQPGDMGLVGYKNGDMPLQPFFLPGTVQAKEPKEKQAILPGEVKTISDMDVRKGTRVYKISTPAGHGFWASDIEGQEMMQVGPGTGEGMFFVCKSKGSDPVEGPNTASKPRSPSAYTKQDWSVPAGTSKKPGEILRNGQSVCGFVDLNGTGFTCYASDGAGSFSIQANGSNGDSNGPSIFLDSKNNLIILTAGTAQFVVNGPKGQTETCKQVIQEKIKIPVEETLAKNKKFVKQAASYYSKGAGGGNSSNTGGNGSSGSSGSSSGSSGSSSSGSPSSGTPGASLPGAMAGGDNTG